MKRILNISAAFFVGIALNAQQVSLEIQYVDQELVTGYTTCLLYAKVTEPGTTVHAVYGDANNPMELVVNGELYQNDFGGHLASNINPNLSEFEPKLLADSWFTIGGTNDECALWEIGIDFEAFEQGQGFSVNNGAWFLLPDDSFCNADADGKILLAQFTFNESIAGIINLQGKDAAGNPWQERGLIFSMVSESTGIENIENVEILETPISSETETSENAELEMVEESDFTVYPNPYSSGILTIEIETEDAEKIQIDCYDSSGRLVYSQSTVFNQTQIRITDFPDLSSGIYILRVNNKAKQLVIN